MAGADVRVGHQGQLPQIHLRRGFGEALDGQVERLLGVGIQLAEAADDAAQIQQLSTLHQRRRELHGEPPQKALVALLRPRHRRQHQRGLLRRQRVRDDVRAGHELPPDARVPGAVRSDALEEPRERRAARPRDAREGVLRHGLRPCLRDPRRGGGRGGLNLRPFKRPTIRCLCHLGGHSFFFFLVPRVRPGRRLLVDIRRCRRRDCMVLGTNNCCRLSMCMLMRSSR
mmetsp:Transcript_45697/g.129428  ORF Transcript_45697/g.129428 Transcript_45697/m.129428 type:complete len:228 (+) Transcript_45697:993-1676(+)